MSYLTHLTFHSVNLKIFLFSFENSYMFWALGQKPNLKKYPSSQTLLSDGNSTCCSLQVVFIETFPVAFLSINIVPIPGDTAQ